MVGTRQKGKLRNIPHGTHIDLTSNQKPKPCKKLDMEASLAKSESTIKNSPSPVNTDLLLGLSVGEEKSPAIIEQPEVNVAAEQPPEKEAPTEMKEKEKGESSAAASSPTETEKAIFEKKILEEVNSSDPGEEENEELEEEKEDELDDEGEEPPAKRVKTKNPSFNKGEGRTSRDKSGTWAANYCRSQVP